MKKVLAAVLTSVAQLNLWRYRPTMVAITGSAGKTTAKTAIAAVLSTRYRVSAPAGTLNDELGVPAAILGDFSGWFGSWYNREGLTAWFWIRILLRGLRTAVYASAYPEVFVLEYGADRPGDVRRLAHRFPPDIAVVTRIGDVPAHSEFYASAQELAKEKSQLVRALAPTGHALLNFDDLTVLEMRGATDAPVITFGLGEGADVRVTDLQVRLSGEQPIGVMFNASTGGSTMPVAIRGTLGQGISTAAAAAIAVGHVLGVGLAAASEALGTMTSPPGRMRVLDGIKGSVIVDDTYNSSPAAAHLALDTVRGLSGRHVVVLGDMLELGEQTVAAHSAIGTMAATVADELVCVGQSAMIFAEAASNQMRPEHIHRFGDSASAAPAVQKMIRPGDVVLVKGSQGIRMERIVREILEDPASAGALLVRQSRRWLEK